MGYIFISYSHKDKSYVHTLANTLKAKGFEVWVDDRINYGEHWPKVIQQQLDGCESFIVVVSENSYESEWVQNEVARAKRKKKPFFPILLNGDPWLSVEVTQYVDIRDGSLLPKKFYDRLSQVQEGKKEPKELEGNTVTPQFGKKAIPIPITSSRKEPKEELDRLAEKRLVDIPMASSAKGLKEELERLAKRRSVTIGKIAEQIFTFAADNPGAFPVEIEKPRPKPGKHISAKVTTRVADILTQWARRLGRNRAAHCCFLLECAIDDPKLLQMIFR
jgi:hypothetical protein